jgi:hypothetical protein
VEVNDVTRWYKIINTGTYIRPIISDRIFLYVLSDKICLYFTMNSYVELKGYVEGKVPYFSRQKKIGCEMRDLCEDHHCALFANMDYLNWTAQKEPRHITYQCERKEVYFEMVRMGIYHYQS